MKLIQIIDRPIAFQRSFVYVTKSVNASLLLSQAVYWSTRTKLPDGWFYKVRDEWEEETGLTRYEQESARKLLRDLGILEESLRGVPAKLHYRLNEEILRTRLLETPRPDGGKTTNRMVENQPAYIGTETTTEITAESTTKALSTKAVKFRLPDWIDQDKWNDYEDMRKKLKKPMTDKARSLALGKLKDLESKGHHHEDVLDQSVMHSWQGLFPVRDEGGNTGGNSKAQQRTASMVNTVREELARVHGVDLGTTGDNRSSGGTGSKPGAVTIDGRSDTRQRTRALSDGESLFESSD